MEKTLKIALKNKYGLHVRPINAIASAALKLRSVITVRCHGNGPADARYPIQLLTLDASKGDELEFTANGEDAEEAINIMHDLVDGRFGGIE